MSGQQKQLYHCDRCGEVFRSRIKNTSELICTECGLHPVRVGFALLAQMPTLDHSLLDADHGIAGKDAADFISLERKRKQKRAIYMYASWFMLLLITMVIGLYVKKTHDEKEEEREAINKESKDYERRSNKALASCILRFQQFSKSEGENEKARHIYNGTDYLVDIRRYYKNPLNTEEYKNKKLRVAQSKLVEQEGMPSRMNLLIRINYENRYDQIFEAVFWQHKDEKWYLDWPQFTRVGELDWSHYVKNSNISGAYQFRLYARKRRNEYTDDSGYTELVLSKALNMKDKPTDDSTPVLVKQKTELEEEILGYIEKIYNRRLSDKDVLGVIDTAGQARVNVKVAYEEVDGKKVIVLKELISKNWFSKIDKVEEAKLEGK